MDGLRFDGIARLAASRGSRRTALLALAGAAAGGALGVASPDGAAAKCGKSKPCGLCKKCKQGKCAKEKNGTICADGGGACHKKKCVCPGDGWLCRTSETSGLCCGAGQACDADAASCGVCPVLDDICADPISQCGQFEPGPFGGCGCVTSVEDQTVCSSLFFACFDCMTDAQCTAEYGVPSVCLSVAAGCAPCDTSTVCMTAACEAPPEVERAAESARGRFQRGKFKPAALGG
jgi:hypothetical protein